MAESGYGTNGSISYTGCCPGTMLSLEGSKVTHISNFPAKCAARLRSTKTVGLTTGLAAGLIGLSAVSLDW